MPLKIIRQDIRKMHTDIIVNSCNPLPTYANGVDRLIYEKANTQELLAYRKRIGYLDYGNIGVTPGCGLDCKYIIHVSSPEYIDGLHNEHDLLKQCYEKALFKTVELGCTSIAFPFLSTGTYAFPKDEAIAIAMNAITNFLLEHELDVYLVVYDHESFHISSKLFDSIVDFITPISFKTTNTFQQQLFHYIDTKQVSNVEVYKNANMSRKLFSKIQGDIYYQPSKKTVLALCISLKLNIEETIDLLSRAGYALSEAKKFDMIIKECIIQHIYNIHDINILLFNNYEDSL